MITELINKQKFQIPDFVKDKYGPLVLTKNQVELINAILRNDRLIVKKNARLGVSTTLDALLATMLMCQENVRICIYISDTRSGNVNINNIKRFIMASKNKFVVEKITSKKIKLTNGNYIKLINSVYDIGWLKEEGIWFWLDEIAFSNKIENIYNEIIEKTKKPKVIITSKPNGIDNLFFPLYILGKKAGYEKIDMQWSDSELYDEKSIYVKQLDQKNYDTYYSGNFIVKNYDNIDINNLIKNINKYNISNEEYTISDFNDLIESGLVKKIDENTYPEPKDGYVHVNYNLGIIKYK